MQNVFNSSYAKYRYMYEFVAYLQDILIAHIKISIKINMTKNNNIPKIVSFRL